MIHVLFRRVCVCVCVRTRTHARVCVCVGGGRYIWEGEGVHGCV